MASSPMQPMQPTTATTTTDAGAPSGGSFARAMLSSLVPLAFVVPIVIIALVLAALARQLTAGQGFYTQQWAAVIVIAVGLLAAAASYIVSCVRTLRHIKLWQHLGQAAQANGALWGLVVVALIVLLPLLLAVFIPQHPAPTLAP